jgi:RimJ/RimL family protein N-acetyltransferase
MLPVLSDPMIYSYIADGPPVSTAALAERYQRLEVGVSPDGSQRWLNWAIRLTEDRQCIGCVQATIYPQSTADLAFVLSPKFWGLGLAREASAAALTRLFTEFGVTAVFATADKRNARSCALLQRLGFKLTSSYPHGAVEEGDAAFRLESPAGRP